MTERTFEIWVVISFISIVAIVLFPYFNYYLSSMDKLRIKALKGKPEKQRNNNIIRLKQFIDTRIVFPWMAVYFYIVVLFPCFIVLGNRISDHLLFKIGFWLVCIIIGFPITFSYMVSLLERIERDAIRDLKEYYRSRYEVTIVYIDKSFEKEYYDYTRI